MLSRVCALWLVTLIVLPFTAPFATCDAQASRPSSLVRAQSDSSTFHALPAARARTGGRVKLALLAASNSAELTPPPALGRIHSETANCRFALTPLSLPLRL